MPHAYNMWQAVYHLSRVPSPKDICWNNELERWQRCRSLKQTYQITEKEQFPPSFPVCVRVCVCVPEHIWIHECVGVYTHGIIFICSATLVVKAGALDQAQSWQIQLLWLASLLWGALSLLSRSGTIGRYWYRVAFIQILGIQTGPDLCSKHFNHWAIFKVLRGVRLVTP